MMGWDAQVNPLSYHFSWLTLRLKIGVLCVQEHFLSTIYIYTQNCHKTVELEP